MKITRRQLRRLVRETLSESYPTYGLKIGDKEEHADDDMGIGRVVAKGPKTGPYINQMVLVMWERHGTQRHHPGSLRKWEYSPGYSPGW